MNLVKFYLCKGHEGEHDWERSPNVKAAPRYRYEVLQLLVPLTFYDNMFVILGVILRGAIYDEDFASCNKFGCESSWAMCSSSETPGN